MRILCVEDEPEIRELLRLALGSVKGYEVRLCASGEEALRLAGSFQPDVILLDVMMPGLDGPSTVQKLRAHECWKATPVVFLTAKVAPDGGDAWEALGIAGVISKPFDPIHLPEEIQKILWRKPS